MTRRGRGVGCPMLGSVRLRVHNIAQRSCRSIVPIAESRPGPERLDSYGVRSAKLRAPRRRLLFLTLRTRVADNCRCFSSF